MSNPFSPLIDIAKYVTQYGQLKTMGRDNTGDATVTATTTIRCLVYQEMVEQRDQFGGNYAKNQHFAVVASSLSLSLHDHLAVVVDQYGNSVLSDSRIVDITDYNHWRYGPRFKRLTLDVDLD